MSYTYANWFVTATMWTLRPVDILLKQKGHENIALIADCMTAGGLEDGDMLGEFPVVADGTARLKSAGNLAGSILETQVSWKMWSNGVLNPLIRRSWWLAGSAKNQSHIDDICGRDQGKFPDADFIVLDKDLRIVATYLDGQNDSMYEAAGILISPHIFSERAGQPVLLFNRNDDSL